MNLPTPKRCAVYCRVSTDERLDQSFNSIDAQKESGLAYVASQRAEGWIPVPDDYIDPGFSGGNLERPGLKRLMADIEAGKIDIAVVYKIDRLTRSLTDFSRLIEVFERNKVSFVAVTQQFNTTTSMGRLMLNVLLSFAQFEREVMVPSAEPPPGGHTPPRWQRTQVHVGVHRSYSRRSAAQLPIPVDATSCSSRWSISSTLIGFSDALPKPATWHSPSISP